MLKKTRKETARRSSGEGKTVSYLLASPKTTGSEYLTVMVAEYQPGADHTLHTHNPEQVYYILEGSGEITVGDETARVEAGDCVFIPSEVPHKLKNDGNVVLKYLCCSAPLYNEDVEQHWNIPSEQ